METTFCELRNKDVINICNGKNLGNIVDIAIDTSCGKISGIIIPSSKSFFNFLKNNNNVFIPFNRICKIGQDIILVDIFIHEENCQFNNVNCCNTELMDNNKKNIDINTIINSINKNKDNK